MYYCCCCYGGGWVLTHFNLKGKDDKKCVLQVILPRLRRRIIITKIVKQTARKMAAEAPGIAAHVLPLSCGRLIVAGLIEPVQWKNNVSTFISEFIHMINWVYQCNLIWKVETKAYFLVNPRIWCLVYSWHFLFCLFGWLVQLKVKPKTSSIELTKHHIYGSVENSEVDGKKNDGRSSRN